MPQPAEVAEQLAESNLFDCTRDLKCDKPPNNAGLASCQKVKLGIKQWIKFRCLFFEAVTSLNPLQVPR